MEDVQLSVWPWGLGEVGELEAACKRGLTSMTPARRFTCTVKDFTRGSLYATVRWKPGYEVVFAPAAGLIPLALLCQELNPRDRVRLGNALVLMNTYWAAGTNKVSVGSDREAFRRALTALLGEEMLVRCRGCSEAFDVGEKAEPRCPQCGEEFAFVDGG